MTGITMPWARHDVHAKSVPFPYGWVDGLLPADLYGRLAESFIMPDTHPELSVLGKGKKRVSFMMPPVPESLGRLSPDWTAFMDHLSRPDIRAGALDWVRKLLPLESVPDGPYRELFSLRHALTPDQVCWYCEFSSLDAGVFLPPHSDSTDKLLIFVLFFAPEGWQPEWDGGTEVYAPLDAAQSLNFSNFFLPHDRVSRLDRCEFRPNRAFFFVKNHASWHGVSPVNLAARLPRRSFNFSLRVRPDAPVPPTMAALMNEIREREAVAFPQ